MTEKSIEGLDLCFDEYSGRYFYGRISDIKTSLGSHRVIKLKLADKGQEDCVYKITRPSVEAMFNLDNYLYQLHSEKYNDPLETES